MGPVARYIILTGLFWSPNPTGDTRIDPLMAKRPPVGVEVWRGVSAPTVVQYYEVRPKIAPVLLQNGALITKPNQATKAKLTLPSDSSKVVALLRKFWKVGCRLRCLHHLTLARNFEIRFKTSS
ncbi:hypothetical protein AVEN_272602-1 [Araneus ventricosus]|uniref:Uncharacterized protein n=1 Tax=Araneus ventricosus TaxID=182803 RepID=A0A4Y2GGE6_ARAVE|nr:hypothetical protein AVEN_272602-1 [Araneus ventricosus]